MSRAKKTISTAAIVAVIIAGVSLLIKYTATKDAELKNLSDCIVATAEAEGYAGNPYSREAWDIFYQSCIINI